MTPIRRDPRLPASVIHFEVETTPGRALAVLGACFVSVALCGVVCGFALARAGLPGGSGGTDGGLPAVASLAAPEEAKRKPKPKPAPPPQPAPDPDKPPKRPDPMVGEDAGQGIAGDVLMWRCPTQVGEYGPDCRGQ